MKNCVLKLVLIVLFSACALNAHKTAEGKRAVASDDIPRPERAAYRCEVFFTDGNNNIVNSKTNLFFDEKGKELTSHSRKSKCTVVEDSTKSGLAFSTHVVHVPKKREGQDKANPIVILFQFFRSSEKIISETDSPCRDISYNRNKPNETSGYDLGGWAILGNQSLEKTIGNRAGEWGVHVACSQY